MVILPLKCESRYSNHSSWPNLDKWLYTSLYVPVLLHNFHLTYSCCIFCVGFLHLDSDKSYYSRNNENCTWLEWASHQPLHLVFVSRQKCRHACWENKGRMAEAQKSRLCLFSSLLHFFFPSKRSCSRLEPFFVFDFCTANEKGCAVNNDVASLLLYSGKKKRVSVTEDFLLCKLWY